jgi:serralysin
LPSYAPGSQGWFLFLHEIGHTLGLKHPHDDGGTGRPIFSNLGLGTLNQDWATAMSYNDDGAWNSFSWDPATPMLFDVIGLMYLYGINQSTNAGNSTSRLTESNTYLSLWDASGIDTLDASSALSGWTILMPDKTVSNLVDVKVGFALPTSQLFSSVPTTLSWLIGDYELAVGSSYDDEILGNSFNNQISGGFGNDEILGGLGDDSIDGGPGIDTAFFQSVFSSAQISYSSSTGRYSVKTTEGTDSLKDIEYFQFSDRALKSSESITVALPSYSLVAQGTNTVDEGQSAVFTLMTTSVATGTPVAYTITGVSAADIVGGALSGSVTVGSNGQATISIPISVDRLTEGNEILTVVAQGQSASVTVRDTSTTPVDTTPPTIAVASNTTALTPGQTALLTFTLSEASTNFTVSDVAVSGGTLSNFSGSGTSYTATFTPTANSTTAGVVSVASGVFTDAAGNANADGSEADNRVTMTVNTVNIQYALSAGASTYDEGQTAAFSLTATGGSVGSAVSYTVSGVTAADLTNGTLSGSVVLGAGGRATISLPIAADRLTEGNETLTVSVGSVSASTTIRDTSTALTSTTNGATKTYTAASTQASVRSSDGGATWTVVTPSGTETLANSDRLRFSDKTIALDFDRGEAGHKTVTMIGAAFGKSFINQYFGAGVSLFDSGQSMAQIAQLVVSTGLIESMVGSSNSAWVRHVYKNVVGVNPDAFTEAVYRTYLDNGTHTKASLLELAAGVTALESQIDLVGIRADGIGYVPFI